MQFSKLTAGWLYVHYGVQCNAYGLVTNLPIHEVARIVNQAMNYLDEISHSGCNLPEYQAIREELKTNEG